MSSFEESVVNGVHWLRLALELLGALAIAAGAVAAGTGFVRSLARRESCTAVRLGLARYLALGLEFQLAADILSTAIAPTWDQLGRLGVIAIIRTMLNFFLTRELREAELAAGAAAR